MGLINALEASGSVALDDEIIRVGAPETSKVGKGSISSPGPAIEAPTGSVREEVRRLPGVGSSPVSFFRGAFPILISKAIPQVEDPAPVIAAKIDKIPDRARFKTALDEKVQADAPVRRDQVVGIRDGVGKFVNILFAQGQVRGIMPPAQRTSAVEREILTRAGVVPKSAGQSDRIASKRGPMSLNMRFISANESREFEILSDDPTARETASQTSDSNEGIFSGPIRNVAMIALLVGAIAFTVV